MRSELPAPEICAFGDGVGARFSVDGPTSQTLKWARPATLSQFSLEAWAANRHATCEDSTSETRDPTAIVKEIHSSNRHSGRTFELLLLK